MEKFINDLYINICGELENMKGKVVIDYEQTDEGKCSWKFKQEGNDELDNNDLVYLLETVIRDIMEEQDKD